MSPGRQRLHFPPPLTVEEMEGKCFIVKEHNGQKLAHVYFEEEPGRGDQRPSC
jgi:hypothetical protein